MRWSGLARSQIMPSTEVVAFIVENIVAGLSVLFFLRTCCLLVSSRKNEVAFYQSKLVGGSIVSSIQIHFNTSFPSWKQFHLLVRVVEKIADMSMLPRWERF